MLNNLRMNIRAKILVGYVLVFVCLGVLLWVVSERLNSLQREADYIGTQDIELHRLTHEIEKNVLEMETGQRGFVITGEEAYLEPYRAALSTWELNYNELNQLIIDNPVLTANLASIKENIEQWVESAGEPAIRLKQAGQNEEALHFFINDPGRPAMDTMRSQFGEFRSTVRGLTNERLEALENSNHNLMIWLYSLWGMAAIATIAAALYISRSIAAPIRQITDTISDIAAGGNLSRRIKVHTRDEVQELASKTNTLLDSVNRQTSVKDQAAVLTALLQSADRMDTLVRFFIHRSATVLNAAYAALYINHNDQELVKAAAYADPNGEPWDKVRDRFVPGEGLVGQCMVEQRILDIRDLPPNYIRIESGLGDGEPTRLILAPVVHEGQVLAVAEFAFFNYEETLNKDLLEQMLKIFGTALKSMSSKMEIEQLYREAQALNEELQVQSEELQAQTEELQAQTEELQLQAEEALELNAKLEAQNKAALLSAQEIEQYAVQVEETSRYKSQFLANMSHELRTPLNSMLILSQILWENKQGNLSEEEQNYASVIHKSGSELLDLINDILDLSKVEAGKMQIESGLVNLSELPEIMNNYFLIAAENKGLGFHVEIDPAVPDAIYSDALRLHQILRNLVSNALKFTKNGFVKLDIRKVDSVITNNYTCSSEAVAFTVEDTGVGISEDLLDMIFEAFTQGDEGTARKYGGTGLGLSISMQLAKLLGGHITVESEQGEGSRFTFYLPIKGRDTDTEKLFILSEAAPTLEKSYLWKPETFLLQEEVDLKEGLLLQGKTALVVDDDIRNVYGLTNALEKVDMRVLTAQNGYECLQILESGEHIDIVLLDILMPEMDGLETLKRIRENSDFRAMPVVVLTAKAMKEDKDRCLAAGADGYLSKPAQLSDIISAIRSSLLADIVN